jgi:hypothetical protein
MSDLVHQEEDFQGNSTDEYYIVNKYTGRAQGKIELHQIEDLAIVQAKIPEPDYITAHQRETLVSPRNITIVPTNKEVVNGETRRTTTRSFRYRTNHSRSSLSGFWNFKSRVWRNYIRKTRRTNSFCQIYKLLL